MQETDELPEEILREISEPIIVYPGTEDMVVHSLRQQILKERLALAGAGEKTATDAEVTAYMMGSSLSFPLSHEWAQVYFYAFTKTMDGVGTVVPDDLRVMELSSYVKNEYYARLKAWLYERRKKGVKAGKKDKRHAPGNSVSAAVAAVDRAMAEEGLPAGVAPVVADGSTGWLF